MEIRDTVTDKNKVETLNKLIENQAKQFEEFGKYMSLQLRTLYQEFIKKQDETLKKCLKFYENYQKEIIYQRDLVNDLSARVENLEIHSNKNDQDIKKFRQDFYHLLKLCDDDDDNRSKIKDYENILKTYKDLSLDDNENILNNTKSTKSFSSFQQENISKLDQIHIKIQDIIIRRENIGKIIKKRNFRILSYNFTSKELIQYTKSEIFNSLNNDVKRIIKNLINKMLQDESTNLGGKWMNKSSNWRDNVKNATELEDTSSNRGDNAKNVGDNTKDGMNQANNHANTHDNIHANIHDNIHDNNHDNINDNIHDATPTLENLHSKIQQIIIQKEILGYKVRLRHFQALLKESYTISDFIQYTKTNQFYSLVDNLQRLINLFIHKNLSQEFEQEDLILSQDLEEYTKRDLIPELPSKYNNYTEYRKSGMFHGLKKNLKRNVEKLVELEERLANYNNK
jgi:hypothetical protein